MLSIQPSGVLQNQQLIPISTKLRQRFVDKVALNEDRCSNGEGCNMQKIRWRLVIDRLTPVLHLKYYEDITSHKSIRKFGPFNDLTIAYDTKKSQNQGVEVKYQCSRERFFTSMEIISLRGGTLHGV